MSVKSFFKSLLKSKAAATVEAYALTEAQKAVLALKNTAIGAVVAADIKSVTNARLSGQQKFEAVVANTLPLIVQMLAEGGTVAVVKEVEDIGRALVQSVFNDVASTKAGGVASLILKLLRVK